VVKLLVKFEGGRWRRKPRADSLKTCSNPLDLPLGYIEVHCIAEFLPFLQVGVCSDGSSRLTSQQR